MTAENSQSFSDHQTSTPVTNCELSFRSASKKYAQITHKNITRISPHNTKHNQPLDTSDFTTLQQNLDYSGERVRNRSLEEKRRNNGSSDKKQNRVLSPEQIGVKTFLQKRRSSESYHPGSGQRLNLSSCSPVASSTFYTAEYVNPAEISPVLNTINHSSQVSSSKNANDSNRSSIRNGRKTSQPESPISPVVSELSYTFRNDSQMIPSTGEENLQGYTTNNFIPGFTTNNFTPAQNALISESEESVSGGERMIVEADIETHCHVERATLVQCEPDQASLTNVTECSREDASCYTERNAELHRSRWVNKDVHMFGRSGGLEAIQADIKTKSPKPRKSSRMDERGDGRKPPLPGKRLSSEHNQPLTEKGALDDPQVDFLREAERHLDQYQQRMRREVTVGACMERQPRPPPLLEESEDGVSEQEIVPENITRNDAYWKTDETHEFEKMEKELKDESKCLAQKLSRTRSHPDMTDSVSPHGEGKYGRSASCTTSISGETRQLTQENAKYHFLHEKGMIKISSPGLKIVSESPLTNHTPHHIDNIDEESTDLAESDSEVDMNDIIINNKFSLFQNNDHSLNSEISAATLDDQERRQKEVESQIIEDYINTVDSHQAMWDNIQDWMAKDGSEPGTEELQAELDMLVKQEETTLQSRSPPDESVYYSFQGQSEELRNVLSLGEGHDSANSLILSAKCSR